MLWKNNIGTRLTDASNIAEALSVAVSGNDVYVLGYEIEGNPVRVVAKYWKNGVPTVLSSGSFITSPQSIAVQENDVYIAGYSQINNGNFIAKYWKNGRSVDLTDGTLSAAAYDAAVEGDDVYVVGIVGSKATCWKNNSIIFQSSESSSGHSIAIAGKDIYVAGAIYLQGIPKAAFWKIGNPTPVVIDSGAEKFSITSIAVLK